MCHKIYKSYLINISFMKALFFLLLISSLLIAPNLQIKAQNVVIPDSIFKAELVGNSSINTNGDTAIQISEATAFTGTINVDSKNISSLTGIEAFTTLTSLICLNNQLSVLDISSNTALTTLNCSYNQLSSVDASNNTSITFFNCSNN